MTTVKGFAVKKVLATAVVAGAILFSPLSPKANSKTDVSSDKPRQKREIERVFERQEPKSDTIIGIQPKDATLFFITAEFKERLFYNAVVWWGDVVMTPLYPIPAYTNGIASEPFTYSFNTSLGGTPYANVAKSNIYFNLMINLPEYYPNNPQPMKDEISRRLTLAGVPRALVNAASTIVTGENTPGYTPPSKALIAIKYTTDSLGNINTGTTVPLDAKPHTYVITFSDGFTTPLYGTPATNTRITLPINLASINGINDFTITKVSVCVGGNNYDPYQHIFFYTSPSGLIISSIQTIGINQNTGKMPANYSLSQNFPNPFNSATTISYSVPKKEKVSIKVYNTLGKEEATLVNETKAPGNYDVRWAGPASSGVYFYTMTAGSYTETRKMVVVK